MQKRVFIVHGWKSSPTDCWFPWLEKELTERGCQVFVPAMPNPSAPDINEWLLYLQKEVGEPDVNTFLIGHSLGAFISLKYAETIAREGKKVGGIITVGGIVHREGRPHVDDVLVKKGTLKLISLFSDNDYHVPLSEEVYFRELLGAETIVLHGRGHFSRLEHIVAVPEIVTAFDRFH